MAGWVTASQGLKFPVLAGRASVQPGVTRSSWPLASPTRMVSPSHATCVAVRGASGVTFARWSSATTTADPFASTAASRRPVA